MTNSGHRALFLDRDGVINQEVGYLHRREDVHWVDGIFRLCRRAKALDFRMIVVTNQAGIGRGLYTTEDFEALMRWMEDEFRIQGAALDAVYHCPYHPEHGVGEWRREHEDRKPGPGMLRRAARDLGLNLTRSILVGDRCTDVGAANAAGLKQAFLLTGTEFGVCDGNYMPVKSLVEVEQWLEANG